MTNILSILKKWGIDVPNGKWYPEYLQEYNASNFFFIDKFPLSVSNTKKFDQVDIFYQEVLERKVSKSTFMTIEKKYRNAMTKLWLYNEVIVETDILSLSKASVKKIDKQYINTFKKLKIRFRELNCVNVNTKEELEVIIQLGIRDIAETSYYFIEQELIIVPSWSCFLIYFRDLCNFDFVKDIFFSEGLFLRPCNEPVAIN